MTDGRASEVPGEGIMAEQKVDGRRGREGKRVGEGESVMSTTYVMMGAMTQRRKQRRSSYSWVYGSP